jgi:Skp family chaperone for outer membrane proteins
MRKLLCAGVGCLILSAVVLVGRSWSAAKPAPPRPRARVALINLTYVIKNYDRFLTFQAEVKATVAPFQAADTKMKEQVEKLSKEAADPATDAERREEIEQKVKELQRSIEDNKTRANRTLTRKQEQQLKTLYRDVEDAARRYAKAQDIELVLHYNDAEREQDRTSPANIMRKMQAGACLPMYAAAGVDISKEISTLLNDAYRRRKASF